MKQQEEVSVARKRQPIVEEPSADEQEPEIVAAVEYPHCACGAVLAMESEQASGKCEACHAAGDFLAEAQAAPIPSMTPEELHAAAAAVKPVQPSLFPPAPFDFTAALEDVFRLTRRVEACRHEYEGLKAEASDAKKQWEAAATACEQATTRYEEEYRASLAAAKRDESLQAAYVEKLEADAAEANVPREAPTAESRVPDLATATPLSDALPACACGRALALDTELERGKCDECVRDAWM